ncbi:MAG: Zn-ribbon domain-containing OB-fold protein [Lautropia sp.]
MLLTVRRFPGGSDSSRLRPLVSPDTAPFYEALAQHRLMLQACESCQRMRWPVAPICPHCRHDGAVWRRAGGRGTVHSFTRYHKAFMPEFQSLLPYVVLNVALAEGPRLIGRWLSEREVRIGMPVAMAIERWDDGLCVPAFVDESS